MHSYTPPAKLVPAVLFVRHECDLFCKLSATAGSHKDTDLASHLRWMPAVHGNLRKLLANVGVHKGVTFARSLRKLLRATDIQRTSFANVAPGARD